MLVWVLIILALSIAGIAMGIKASWALLLLALASAVGLVSSAPTFSAEERKAGETRVDAHGITQVWVPAGSFNMGTDTIAVPVPGFARNELESERPQHKVTLTKGNWIDRDEVTNAAFQAFVDDGGYTNQKLWSEDGWNWLKKSSGRSGPAVCETSEPEQPRACITWYEAEAYANWRGGRIPTEAEWEFAARGPDSPIYPYGNDYDANKANVTGKNSSSAVGGYPDGKSWVGANDMSGNLMEWVHDWLDINYYKQMIEIDPKGPETGHIKVEKGGWFGSNSFVARAAYRHFEDPPSYQDHHIGVRIVTDEPSP
jgi:formylglycine-generating enzyme required for sulfatase activity